VGENKAATLLAVQEGFEGGGEYGGDVRDHPGDPDDLQTKHGKGSANAGQSKEQGGEGEARRVDGQDRHMEELSSPGGDGPLLPVVDGDYSKAEEAQD